MAGCSRSVLALATLVLVAGCSSQLPAPTGSVSSLRPTPAASTRATPPLASPIANAVLTASVTGSCENNNAAACVPVLLLEQGHVGQFGDWKPSDGDLQLPST